MNPTTYSKKEGIVSLTSADRLLTDSVVCDLFGISRTTLWLWRKTRGFPETVIPGDRNHAIRYKVSDVKQWARSNGYWTKVSELE